MKSLDKIINRSYSLEIMKYCCLLITVILMHSFVIANDSGNQKGKVYHDYESCLLQIIKVEELSLEKGTSKDSLESHFKILKTQKKLNELRQKHSTLLGEKIKHEQYFLNYCENLYKLISNLYENDLAKAVDPLLVKAEMLESKSRLEELKLESALRG